jgi:hypothetical protein
MSSSCAQISGTSTMPSLRAAAAGKSLWRSGVAVNQMLIRSSVVSPFRSRMAVSSSLTCSSMCPASSRSSWTAPRTARTATVMLLADAYRLLVHPASQMS